MSLKIIQNDTPVEATKIWIGGEIQAECLRVWSTEANAWVYEALAEATGTLPLAFRSDGTVLLDYRIYGNTLTTKLNLWEWGNTNYRIDLTTPIAANTTLTYAVFKDGIANNAEGIYLYDANGSRILNAVCANTDGNRIYATVTPTRDVHRIELSPMVTDALRMLTEGDTPPDEYISPETTEIQGVGVRTENLFDPNAAEEDGGKIISDFMPLDPSGQYITIAFDIEPRTSYTYEITYYDSAKTAISFVGGMGEAYKTRETVKLNRQSEAPNAAYVKVTLPKDLTNVLIQNGSTSGEYIPYGHKLTIVSRTENLFDVDDPPLYPLGYYLNIQGVATRSTSTPEWYITNYIKVKELTTYYLINITQGTSYGSYTCFYDSNKNFIGSQETRNQRNKKVTTPQGCVYMCVSREQQLRTMVIMGDEIPGNYIPYHRTDTPIYIGDTQLTKDEYVSYSEGKIYKKVNDTLTPQDPPVPLPQLPTFSDTDTVLDYEETPAPEEVWVKYHKK